MTGVRTSPPVIGDMLTKRLRTHARPNPVVAPLLASDALKCARRIGYRLFGTPPDIRYTQHELARFEDGDFVDAIAAEVFAIQEDARIQVPFNWLNDGVPLKGKADAGYRNADGEKVIAEVKSQGEKGWTRAVGMWEGVPASPKPEWLVQAGLGACAPTIDAEWVHVVLVDNDRLEVAEWVLHVDAPIDLPESPTRNVGEDTVRSLTLAEVERQALILNCCEGGTLPPRDVPGYGIVTDPPGRDEYGEPWQCRFCPYQPSCSKAGGGAIHDFGEMAA